MAQLAQCRRPVEPGDAGGDVHGEAPAQDGRRFQERDTGRIQVVHALKDGGGDRRGHVGVQRAGHRPAVALPPNEVAAVDHGGQQFLHDEGDTFGDGVQAVKYGCRYVARVVVAKTAGGQLRGVGGAEAGEAQGAGRTAGRGGLGEVEGRSGPTAQRGQQDGPLAGKVVREVVDDGERVGVRVVQVLQHQDTAAGASEGPHEPQHRLGVAHQRRTVLRRQPAQSRQQRLVRAQVPVGGRPFAAQSGEHGFRQRAQRHRAPGGRGPPAQHP